MGPALASGQAERLYNAARTLAALHRFLPPVACVAGEPVTGPAEEIDRWSQLLSTVDRALVPGWEEVAGALRSSVPVAAPVAIVHGDFRLGNLLAVGDRIAAVVDWEIWSVGDPRVDLGWFLLNADPGTYRRPTRYAGSTPPIAELCAVYVDALGREVRELKWFGALASFKSAATWSLIVKHNRRRPTPDREPWRPGDGPSIASWLLSRAERSSSASTWKQASGTCRQRYRHQEMGPPQGTRGQRGLGGGIR